MSPAWPDSTTFWRDKRVIVTGGSGFLGSFIVDKLRARGAAEVIVPRRDDYDLRDIQAIRQLFAGEQIARYLHPGRVIVLESTTYPGTTREMLLTHFAGNAQGWQVGEDFFLAFSPERVDPGRTDWTTHNTPRCSAE